MCDSQNQILDQVGQTAVGQHEETRHRSGNALGVAVTLAEVVVVGRVCLLIALLRARAARHKADDVEQEVTRAAASAAAASEGQESLVAILIVALGVER